MVGMACGFAMDLYLWLGTRVPWTWWVMIGSAVTFAVGWSVSVALGDPIGQAPIGQEKDKED